MDQPHQSPSVQQPSTAANTKKVKIFPSQRNGRHATPPRSVGVYDRPEPQARNSFSRVKLLLLLLAPLLIVYLLFLR
jgi:hypothetical protein